MATAHTANRPEREKNSAARSSVVAAVGLTAMKLVVGLATGSLGILAEAAHSALDLVAALMTWFAVRTSSKPADPEHPYGHGKIENISAFGETLLLLLTCGWIIYEALHRLIFHHGEVEVTIWSFAIMIISIVVDVSRSRMLRRVAHEHNSQALEADALHFSTDVWSSSVVIVGLAGVKLSQWLPGGGSLAKADAIAAIIVALIAAWVSIRLGIHTIEALLDAAPKGMEQKIIEAVEAIPGVTDCHHVRMRTAGPQLFVDVHVLMDGTQTLSEAHALTDMIEHTIENLAANVDVTVHPEPRAPQAGEQARAQ